MGYGLGSIPFGLLFARRFGAIDIRAVGSGNIGATNVLRTGRKDLAALTLLFDIGKGVVAVLLARCVGHHLAGHYLHFPDLVPIAGGSAFIGHCYPVWLRFRGGKGVATMLGVSFATWWLAGFAFAFVWLLSAKLSRYSSVGGMAGAIAATATTLFFGPTAYISFFAAMTILLLWRHQDNIRRLLLGKETRIGEKK
ncbi:MAG: glycerol-3-phosphate 1-O-acyltransferase PlsY [Zymomonas mobilis subsp. pomaceae]